jgi:menaquinone-9 beta-reductase
MKRPDVVVVGAGPAGIATAIAASLKGLQVTVLDFRKPPIDKACGEGLLPEAICALNALGVDVSREAYPFCGIRFSDEQSSVSARIAGRACGLRRTALHRLLMQRAEELDVRFVWGARVSEFGLHNLIADGRSFSFRWLVGADGQNSRVRKWAGLEARPQARSRFGFRQHYGVRPWSDFVEVYWGERCQIFVTPTGEEEICVALLTDDRQMRIEDGLAEFPDIARRLWGTHAITTETGAVSVLKSARSTVRGNVALVGDASCAIDGIGGQGLSLAFQEAVALGEALAREDLRSYAAAHRRITSSAVRMTRLLLLLGSSVPLRRKALRYFAANPGMFASIMAAHTRARDSEKLQARDVIGLGWRILWA